MELKNAYKIFKLINVVIIIGTAMIVLVSLYNFVNYENTTTLTARNIQSNNWFNFWTCAGLQFLIAGATFMSGALLGFIFGIPKYNQNIISENKTIAIAFSDNLVQVSDWLTKIIVGVGLTQLTKIPGYLERLGKYISTNNHSINPNIAIAIVIYFAICGFAGGYLWTTIYYPQIMKNVYNSIKEKGLEENKKGTDDQQVSNQIGK